jgi:p-hydroxybenzoate 3-monooxygenase
LITPAGGKGMNLAIQDGIELAHGLIERFGPRQDDTRLSAYSRTRLPSIWQTEAFSNWFLHVLLTSLRDGKEPSAAVPGGFSRGLRHGWIAALQNDPLFARWFAHAYAGVDPEKLAASAPALRADAIQLAQRLLIERHVFGGQVLLEVGDRAGPRDEQDVGS